MQKKNKKKINEILNTWNVLIKSIALHFKAIWKVVFTWHKLYTP